MTLRTRALLPPFALLVSACAGPGAGEPVAPPHTSAAASGDDTTGTICANLLRQYAPGHSGYDSDLHIRVVDPRFVTLSDSDGRELLAPASAPSESAFAKGDVQTGERTSGSYAARLERESNGAVAIVWKSTVPLVAGDREVVLSADGSLPTLGGSASTLGFPAALDRERFEIVLCAFLLPVRGGYEARVGTAPPVACSGAPIRITTPWTNVVEIRETSTYMGDFAMCKHAGPTVVVYPQPGRQLAPKQ